MAPKGRPPKPPGDDIVATMTLPYFLKNYVKPFKGNALEVPFRELRAENWKYQGNGSFIQTSVKEADEG